MSNERNKKISKLVTIVILAFTMVFSSVTQVFAKSFDDVKPESWYYSAVQQMTDNNMISGYPDGSFKPDNMITRAEVASILSGLNLPDIIASKKFTDVHDSFWGAKSIDKAYKSGTVLGTNNDLQGDTYLPDTQATRETVAIIASRLFGLQAGYKDITLSQFSDAADISTMGQMHVQNLVKAGIISGYPDGTFKPHRPVTRAEFCRMLSFVCNTDKGQLSNNIKNSFDVEKIFESALKDINIKFDIPHNILHGRESNIPITIKTTGIANGETISLKVNGDNNHFTLPSSVKIQDGVATFTLRVSKYAENKQHTITATYKGKTFTQPIKVNEASDYFTDISVASNLEYGVKSYTNVTVKTKNIPDGTKLDVSVDSGLTVSEAEVKDNKAIYTVYSTQNTKEGKYAFKVAYGSSEKTVYVVVGDYQYANNKYITDTIISGHLKEGSNSAITITVHTKDIPNGQYLDITLIGDKYYNTNYNYSDWGLKVSNRVPVQNNKAIITIYGSSYTPSGAYDLILSHGNEEMRVTFHVGNDYNTTNTNKYITNFYLDGTLNNGINDTIDVTITTKGIADGTRLSPEVAGLEIVGDVTVYNNKATFTVASLPNTSPGYYELNIPYKGYNARCSIQVHGGGNVTGNIYITDIQVSNKLKYGVADTASVTVRTRNLPNGTILYPTIANGLNIPTSCRVENNRAYFKITSTSYTPRGSYRITIPYQGYTATADAYVEDMTSTNRHIKSVSVLDELNVNTNNSTKVIVSTQDIPNGTVLYPTVSGALKVSGSCEVYNNEASFYVYNDYNGVIGDFKVNVSYNGREASAIVRVVDRQHQGYIKSITVNDELKSNMNDSVRVNIYTTGLTDGTTLYPRVSGDLSITSSCTVINNQATVFVYNSPGTQIGDYTISISYGGNTSTAIVKVTDSMQNPYIEDISVDNNLKAFSASSATVTIKTRNIANGTVLKPMVQNGLTITGQAIVNNNQAIITLNASSTTDAGAYLLEVPYGQHTTTTTIIVPVFIY